MTVDLTEINSRRYLAKARYSLFFHGEIAKVRLPWSQLSLKGGTVSQVGMVNARRPREVAEGNEVTSPRGPFSSQCPIDLLTSLTHEPEMVEIRVFCMI